MAAPGSKDGLHWEVTHGIPRYPRIPACHTVACLELSGQQTQAVSDREGFSARVQQVGVWCRCVAFFWPVLPHFPSVLLCSQPRFPACSCQLSCSLFPPSDQSTHRQLSERPFATGIG